MIPATFLITAMLTAVASELIPALKYGDVNGLLFMLIFFAVVALFGWIYLKANEYYYCAKQERQSPNEPSFDAHWNDHRQRQQPRQSQSQPRQSPPRQSPPPPSLPPAVIAAIDTLGLPPKTCWSEVNATYRALIGQYHPDKVAHLGPALRELASAKSLEINLAFQTIKKYLGK
jgi:hypothetical protein